MPHARKRRPSSLDMVMLDFMNQWTPAPVWMASDAALRIALYLSAEAILIARTVPHPVTTASPMPLRNLLLSTWRRLI